MAHIKIKEWDSFCCNVETTPEEIEKYLQMFKNEAALAEVKRSQEEVSLSLMVGNSLDKSPVYINGYYAEESSNNDKKFFSPVYLKPRTLKKKNRKFNNLMDDLKKYNIINNLNVVNKPGYMDFCA